MKKVIFNEVEHVDEPLVCMWVDVSVDDNGDVPFFDTYIILELNKYSMN